LRHTLGCPDTFEFRREEIQILTQIFGQYPPRLETHDFTPIGDLDNEPSYIRVDDEDVVNSFLYEISKEGSLYQYLKLSQVSFSEMVHNDIQFVVCILSNCTQNWQQ
jgi:hypothetical protein